MIATGDLGPISGYLSAVPTGCVHIVRGIGGRADRAVEALLETYVPRFVLFT